MSTVESSKAAPYYHNVKSHEEKSVMGKDDFLKILVTQLQNQDPLQPLQDREFIGQMTQFSTLEQITNLNKTFSDFKSSQSNLSQYAQMINKEVSWLNPDTAQSESGTVSAVTSRDGQFYYMVDNKQIRVDHVFYVRSEQI
jgi:flagellar basal-body rod modification protein FlgD